MKRILLYIAIASALVAGFAGVSAATGVKSHMDIDTNPDECMSCHAGRGISGTALLRQSREDLCFACHGDSILGRRKDIAKTNIKAVMEKRSAHPVADTSMLHRIFEKLPEKDSAKKRHVACQDCHRVHITTDMEPTKGARGYLPGSVRSRKPTGVPKGLRLKRANNEYEICYLCHADSANLPGDSNNIAAEFNPDNASYHPIEMRGRNKNVPSLMRGLTENSMISCISCHGNDDPSGPSGPHGSDYEHILVAKYNTYDGPEYMSAYELCYTCHRRSSILGDESFRLHQLHIAIQETACYTCHASHGSELNLYLISFNRNKVDQPDGGGSVMYIPGGAGTPKCYLKCHETNHTLDKVGDKAWPW